MSSIETASCLQAKFPQWPDWNKSTASTLFQTGQVGSTQPSVVLPEHLLVGYVTSRGLNGTNSWFGNGSSARSGICLLVDCDILHTNYGHCIDDGTFKGLSYVVSLEATLPFVSLEILVLKMNPQQNSKRKLISTTWFLSIP